MKAIPVLIFCSVLSLAVYAQKKTYEIKVITKQFKSVKGSLKKVSEEGIGVEDYQGNYLVYRPQQISRIKVRRRGLTIGRATVEGTAIGGTAGLLLMTINAESEEYNGILAAAVALTVTGAVLGSTTGVICEIANNRLLLNINEDAAQYQKVYKKLLPYVDAATIEKFN